ncbi:efflux RND transporter periplasmic adaptor subunit [Pirellulaceae bacterium SH449]
MRRSEASEPIKTPKSTVANAGDASSGGGVARSASKLLEGWETTFGSGSIDSLNDRRNPVALDSPFVQQTKDKIRELVSEITRFSQKPVSPSEFIQYAFPRILTAMGADGIAIWAWRGERIWNLVQARGLAMELTSDSGASVSSEVSDVDGSHLLEDLDQIELQLAQAAEPTPTSSAILPSSSHERLLNEARNERQPVLIPPRDATINSQRAPNPTSQIVMLVPISVPMNDGELWLEIFQHPSGGLASQRGYLRFAAQMAELISEFLKTFRMRILEHDQEFLLTAQKLLDRSLQSQPRGRSMSTILGCIRDNVGADHVFWLHRRSHRQAWRVKSIAGLDKIDRRVVGIDITEDFANSLRDVTNGIREYQLSGEENENRSSSPALAEERRFRETFSLRHGVWFDPNAVRPDRPLRSQTLIEELLPDVGDATYDSSAALKTEFSRSSNDALIIVWADDSPQPANGIVQSSLLFRLGHRIVEPKATSGNRLTAFAQASLKGVVSQWGLFLLFLVALTGILAIPVPVMVESSAVLVPLDIEELYAPMDGVVERVLVQHGQRVDAGTPLVQLQSTSLTAEREKSRASIIQHEQRLADLDNRLLRDRGLAPIERDSLETERETIRIALKYEQKALELIDQQWEQLTIRAKSAAIVETWQVDESLNGRPVRMGQWLFSLRSPTTKWELEAKIPERNLDEITRSHNNPQSASFARLIASPKDKWSIQSKPPESWRSLQQQSGDVVPMYLVRFQVSDDFPDTLAMAGATARISVSSGKASLAWALSKDFVETFLMRVRMWFP